MPLISGPTLFERLRSKIASAKSACLAIAYWGTGAVAQLGLHKGQNIKILCNLAAGGTNPDEIRRTIKLGASVLSLDRLHAKVGVVLSEEGRWGFPGSSNASQNGWGFVRNFPHLHELNLVIEGGMELSELDGELDLT